MEATSVSNSPLEVIDAQLEMVLLIADANRRARAALQALVAKRKEACEPAKLRLVMPQLASEIGIDTTTLSRLCEGSQAFLPSALGQKVLTYCKMGNDWEHLKAAYLRTTVSDGLASIALFPTHLIRLVFDIRMQLVAARDLGAVTDDLACALQLSDDEFESLSSGKIELIRSFDPTLDQTGERYRKIRALLDGSDLESLVLECMKHRQAADQVKLAELHALRDTLIQTNVYSCEAEICRKLFGRGGTLAGLRSNAKSAKLSETRLAEVKRQLEAEIARINAGGELLTVAPSDSAEEPVSPEAVSEPELPPALPPPLIETQEPRIQLIQEMSDLAEQALTDAVRLLVTSLRHQVGFLMNLGDRHADRFVRIWGRLSPDIEDLRDHLEALYSESPSVARKKLAALQRDRSKRSLIAGG